MDGEERFAEAFERYIWEGRAPSEKMKNIFQKFVEFMRSVYDSVMSKPDISEDIRGVFDNLLSKERIEALRADEAISSKISMKENFLFQSVEESDIFTDEELEEIGVSYGSKEKYRKALNEALEEFSSISSRQKRRYINTGGQQLSQNKSIVPYDKIKRVDITGKTVQSPHELAALLQFFRNPRIEIMNILYLSSTGEVLAHTAFSSGLPSRTQGVEKFQDNFIYITRMAKSLNAESVYLAHNHPSGNPESSTEDIHLTAVYKKELGELFKGHLILDHDKYNYIDSKALYDDIYPLDSNFKKYTDERREKVKLLFNLMILPQFLKKH